MYGLFTVPLPPDRKLHYNGHCACSVPSGTTQLLKLNRTDVNNCIPNKKHWNSLCTLSVQLYLWVCYAVLTLFMLWIVYLTEKHLKFLPYRNPTGRSPWKGDIRSIGQEILRLLEFVSSNVRHNDQNFILDRIQDQNKPQKSHILSAYKLTASKVALVLK